MVKELHGRHLVLDVLRAVLPCIHNSAAFHSDFGIKRHAILVFRIRTETIADPDPAFYLNTNQGWKKPGFFFLNQPSGVLWVFRVFEFQEYF